MREPSDDATVIELELGDIVKLKEPWEESSPDPFGEPNTYTHGIVAEILTFFSSNSAHNDIPRNVSLYLFDSDTNELNFHPGPGEYGIPAFTDFHVRNLILVQKANALSYDPQQCSVIQESENIGDQNDDEIFNPRDGPSTNPPVTSEIARKRVLTDDGKQFIADWRRYVENHVVERDPWEDWELRDVGKGHIRIPDTYEGYGTLHTSDVPLVLKAWGSSTDTTEIRHHARDTYPHFLNEVFGEVAIWKEAQQRGEPHTDLFAPVFEYDENYEWLVAAYATNIKRKYEEPSKKIEEQGKSLGWVPDDTETGKLNGDWVAVDYGDWWRLKDDWETDVTQRPYVKTGNWSQSRIRSTQSHDHESSQKSNQSVSNRASFIQWLKSLL